MATVPQPYNYDVSVVSGGEFPGSASDHLKALILAGIPAGVNPIISESGPTITVSFDADLTTADKATLDSLVPRAADYYIITTDGGVTDLGDPATISQPVGILSSSNITLQYKSGNGVNSNGYGDSVVLTPSALMPISASTVVFNGSGKATFTVGASVTQRGAMSIALATNTVLPPTSLITVWT